MVIERHPDVQAHVVVYCTTLSIAAGCFSFTLFQAIIADEGGRIVLNLHG
jgi:hypothetical protein